MKIFVIIPSLALLLTACIKNQPNNIAITKEEMLKIVIENDKKFSIGTQTKDSFMLTSIYSDSAQYVQPGKKIIVGKTEIGKEWGGFVKWTAYDLLLNAADVRGNREIIYETGTGTTLYINDKGDSSAYKFNYVNVWRLQSDGTYKLEIDTYN
jgi:ketosteroid isomerase-like protein